MTALAPVVAIAWFIAFALGVALLVARQLRELWRDLRSPRRDGSGIWRYNGFDGVLPKVVQNWLGLASNSGQYRRRKHSLSDDNDRGASFAEIAQTIRTHPELFVDES
jgi:hypothetical protein